MWTFGYWAERLRNPLSFRFTREPYFSSPRRSHLLPSSLSHPPMDKDDDRASPPPMDKDDDRAASPPISRGTVIGPRNSRTRLRVSCLKSRTSEHSSPGARGRDVRMFGCLPPDGPHREGGLLAGLRTYLPLSRTTLTQQFFGSAPQISPTSMRRFELLCGAAPGRERSRMMVSLVTLLWRFDVPPRQQHPPATAPASAYWPPRKNYVHNDRPSMARRSDLIGGRCLRCLQVRTCAPRRGLDGDSRPRERGAQ